MTPAGPAAGASVFQLAYPWLLFFLLLIPLYFFLDFRLKRKRRGMPYPYLEMAAQLLPALQQKFRHSVLILRLLALGCLAAALLRPQGEVRRLERQVPGVDIILALDISESMQADDIRPNRLTAAREVLEQFIRLRPRDRIGLTVFSGASFTLAPLTTDHEAVLAALQGLRTTIVNIEGTAIGDGVLTGVNRLLAPPAAAPGAVPRSRVLILATDGVSNRGVPPVQAAAVAAEKNIRLYTIGLGGQTRVRRIGVAENGRRIPMRTIYGQPIYWELPDEATLTRMAALAHGRYFRAADRSGLVQVMSEIDRLEKQNTFIRTTVNYQEYYTYPLLLALAFLLAERALSRLRFRRLV